MQRIRWQQLGQTQYRTQRSAGLLVNICIPMLVSMLFVQNTKNKLPLLDLRAAQTEPQGQSPRKLEIILNFFVSYLRIFNLHSLQYNILL